MNLLMISGRICRAPELHTYEGKRVLKFSLENTDNPNKSMMLTCRWINPSKEIVVRMQKMHNQSVTITGPIEIKTYTKKDGGEGMGIRIRVHTLEDGVDALKKHLDPH